MGIDSQCQKLVVPGVTAVGNDGLHVDKFITNQVVKRMPEALAELVTELAHRRTKLPAQVMPSLAAEARLLSVLEHMVLRDMLQRLKG